MPTPHPRPRRAPRRLLRSGLALAVMAAAGCQGGTGILRRWNMQKDETLARPITDQELGDNRNMVARWLTPDKAPHTGPAYNATLALSGSKPDPQTEAEIAAAEGLFQQGKLAEAEAAFEKLERKTAKLANVDELGTPKADDKNLWGRVKGGQVFGTPKRARPYWGEKILFYLAECQYQQGRYVSAHESYEKLLNTYPGSPHLEKAVAREYAIADAWFSAGEGPSKVPAPGKGVTLAAGEAKDKDKDESVRQTSWTDHFNGRLPLIDVDGYALKAMEHVRQHDATGPLADDATLRIADHYFARRDYESAAAHYDQLISEYPKSPLLQRAQLGSINSKMKGYLGPEYDSDGLEQAKATIKQTLTGFPDRPASTTDELYHDLDLIADQQAEIAYNNALFYKRTGYPSGAEFYFGEVRARWPKSSWAAKAKDEMATLAKAPRKKILPSKILTLPGASDPNAIGNSMGSMATMPGGGGAGGMGLPAGAGPLTRGVTIRGPNPGTWDDGPDSGFPPPAPASPDSKEGRPIMRTHRSRPVRAFLVAMVAIAPLGCGYTVRPPFDRKITTVYVPVFKSQRFRRDLNLQLTEMLQKEIQDRTPYSVVGSPEQADTRLEGVITFDDKNIVVESPNNLPRHELASLICTVTFIDNRTGASTTRSTPVPPALVAETSPFYPEIGETASLGFQKAMKKMVKDIVSMMEAPWGEEYREDIDLPPDDPSLAPSVRTRGR